MPGLLILALLSQPLLRGAGALSLSARVVRRATVSARLRGSPGAGVVDVVVDSRVCSVARCETSALPDGNLLLTVNF